jgi:hypothetical protein
MTTVVIVLAELMVDRLPSEEVVDYDEDGVGHGDGGCLVSPDDRFTFLTVRIL